MTRTKRNNPPRAFENLDNFKDAVIVNVEALRAAAMERAGEARAKGAAVVTQFEKAFQQRVTKVAAHLGVPSAKEVRALARQVAELEASVAKLRRARA